MNDKIRTDREMIDLLRERLQPKGSADVVALHLGSSRYMNGTFIQKCVYELSIHSFIGSDLSPLQKLGVEILMASAYINPDKDIEIEEKES